MTHRFAACLAIASLTFLAPRPAAASPITRTFNTVDAVETGSYQNVFFVTGILVGQTTTTTFEVAFQNAAASAKCERIALMAVSKPGKYRLAIVGDTSTYYSFGCKLILQTP